MSNDKNEPGLINESETIGASYELNNLVTDAFLSISTTSPSEVPLRIQPSAFTKLFGK